MVDLWDLLRSEVEVSSIFQNRGLPASKQKRKNKHSMKLYISDQVLWQYTIQACRKNVNKYAANCCSTSLWPLILPKGGLMRELPSGGEIMHSSSLTKYSEQHDTIL
jgi:hypothetical protein